jgi:hypothetical protein
MTRVPAFDDLDLYTQEGRNIAMRRVLDHFVEWAVEKVVADLRALVDLMVNDPKNVYRIRRRLARVIIRHLEARR